MSKAVVSPGAGRSPKRLRKEFKSSQKAVKEEDRNENHTFVVRDYDEAIQYFTELLGLPAARGHSLGDGKRGCASPPMGPGVEPSSGPRGHA